MRERPLRHWPEVIVRSEGAIGHPLDAA